jgi:hypothetical protein
MKSIIAVVNEVLMVGERGSNKGNSGDCQQSMFQDLDVWIM